MIMMIAGGSEAGSSESDEDSDLEDEEPGTSGRGRSAAMPGSQTVMASDGRVRRRAIFPAGDGSVAVAGEDDSDSEEEGPDADATAEVAGTSGAADAGYASEDSEGKLRVAVHAFRTQHTDQQMTWNADAKFQIILAFPCPPRIKLRGKRCFQIRRSVYAGMGAASKWKTNMLRNAEALFSRKSRDLQAMVYGSASADDPVS